MKKNITINLYGSLYAIDDDACQLLEQYLNNMRSYFSKRDGGDEIADDIEHRVADLFSELKAQGFEAISIDNVQDIIQRIGNPEQMDEDTNAEQNSQERAGKDSSSGSTPPPAPDHNDNNANDKTAKDKQKGRKLFRDPKDQMLGGVMSGLCHYFGGSDPLPWRILMVLLALFSFSTIGIIYLIAWALIPAAVTAEDRLQMQGKPVNPQTLNEELMRSAQQAEEYVQSAGFKNSARSFGRTILSIIVFCFKLLLLFIIGCMIIGLLMGISFFIAACCYEKAEGDNLSHILLMAPILKWYISLALLSSLACLSIIFYGCLRMLLQSHNTKPLSSGTMITLVITALLSATIATTFGIMSGLKQKEVKREWRIKNNTINGIYINNEDRNKLAIDNWKLTKAENCNDNGVFCGYTDDFDENNELLYYQFNKTDKSKSMNICMERTENLPAGKYHIECVTSIDGPGMFLTIGHDQACYSLISKNNKEQGNFATMPYAFAMTTGMLPDTLSEPWWLYHQRNEVDEWNFQKTNSFDHKGGPLTYSIKGTQGAGANEVDILKIAIVKD